MFLGFANDDFLRELDKEIKQYMVPLENVSGRRTWQCIECDKVGTKTDTVRHIEANHIHHAGFICPMCGMVSKNRNSLRKHISVTHKN